LGETSGDSAYLKLPVINVQNVFLVRLESVVVIF
jgi:hypothetical protein